MDTGKFKLEVKQVDDWAKLLFDALGRIGLLSAFTVIAYREKLFWVLWGVGLAAMCLAYWIAATLGLRLRDYLSAGPVKPPSFGGRLCVAAIVTAALIAIMWTAIGSVQAVLSLAKAQRHPPMIACAPSAKQAGS